MGGRTRSRAAWLVGVGWLVTFVLPAAALADIQIIDSPTAQTLDHGELRWEIGVGPEGGVLSSLVVGAFQQLQFGISYGMLEVLGRGDVEPNPHPAINVRLLAVDMVGLPSIAVGFDGQGQGRWVDALQRYERKSHGFYAVGTQYLRGHPWEVLTTLTGGINFSLEGDRESFDLFLGASQSYGRNLSLLLDYDFGLDDRSDFDADRGYLDFGLQWRFGGDNNIRFLLRDLLGNFEGGGQVARELNFYYLFQL
jgi:hypothetical protein